MTARWSRWLTGGVLLALGLMLAPSRVVGQGTENPHGAKIGSCSTCHAASGWKPVKITAAFRHADGRFPLEGAHAAVSCATCHKSLTFSDTRSACTTCHNDVHNGQLGIQCARCHTTRSFTDQARLSRLHEQSRFPLRGSHATLACESCHTPTAAGQPQYTNRPTSCVSCHAAKYRQTTAPDHKAAGFSQDCSTCHGSTVWQGAKFDHATTAFPLTGGHQTVACADCHGDGVYKGKPTTCVSCHMANFNATTSPPHAVAGIPTTCVTCHTTTAWSTGAPFDHGTTQFPLTGAHRAVTCSQCHVGGAYKGTPTTCVACHQAVFTASKSPPHVASGFSTTCTTCHTTTAWQGAAFDHGATNFPLTGAHRAAVCLSCHASGVYRGLPAQCAVCHQANYDRTTTPPHAGSGFPTTCATCHTTTDWHAATFNHSTTSFPLTGLHQAVTCVQCHGDGVYQGKPTSCVSCHQANYNSTTSPAHQAAGYSTDCASCHGTTGWQGAAFNHANTQFPLTGAHQAVTCVSCHGDGVYHGKSTACASCHQANFNATTNPPHQAANFATTCQTCHTTTTWGGATFDHGTTQFPLTGTHRTAACLSCHTSGVYRGLPSACASCHQVAYDHTTTPPHAASGFPNSCATCHTTTVWTGAVFNHSATQFPLTGAHQAVACLTCHANGVYHGLPSTCVSCHQSNFNATTNPPHAAANFVTTCQTCHTTTTWTGATFDHANTQFPLTGTHRTAACLSCHTNGVYHGLPSACASCHQAAYDHTTTPPHAAAGFPNTCATCHTTTVWTGAAFNHSTTQFPLTGAHLAVTCVSCHGDGVYHGKSTACASCHQSAYNATTHPPHAASNFSTVCSTCHTTTTWTGGTFDHSTTTFPLTGGHAGVTCNSCHGDGVYHGKSTVCSTCHLNDFNATTNPNHRTALFPTTSTSCHTTTTWQGATFNHDPWFPIYSGTHRSRWSTCGDCHTTSNYTVFTCATCHTQTQMDSRHRGRSGYSFTPAACYSCHPRGSS